MVSAAKNLSSYAFDGADYDVDPAVIDLIQATHAAGKPQGFMCIAPVLVARALGDQHVKLTIGNDAVVVALSKGAHHVDCSVDSIVVDQSNWRKLLPTCLPNQLSKQRAG